MQNRAAIRVTAARGARVRVTHQVTIAESKHREIGRLIARRD